MKERGGRQGQTEKLRNRAHGIMYTNKRCLKDWGEEATHSAEPCISAAV